MGRNTLIYHYSSRDSSTETCCCCDKEAEWGYMPPTTNPDIYYCDLCVPRGCSCNIIDLEDTSADPEQHRDDQHRLMPCCEYEYFEEGISK